MGTLTIRFSSKKKPLTYSGVSESDYKRIKDGISCNRKVVELKHLVNGKQHVVTVAVALVLTVDFVED